MTNIEAAKGLIGANYPFDEYTYENGLAYAGLDPNELYVKGKAFDLAMADFILWLATSAKRISEGGYTVEIDATALLQVRSLLLRKWGLDDGQGPRLRNKSWLW